MIQPENEIRRELEDGETILWTGCPNPIQSAKSVLSLVYVSVAWGVVLFFLISRFNGLLASHIGQGPAAFLYVITAAGLVFQAVGAPYWVAQRSKTIAYGVTNQRILVVISGNRRVVRSFSDINLDDVKVVERTGGFGDLLFARPSNADLNVPAFLRPQQFSAIPTVRDVERLVRNTFSRGNRG